MFKIADITLWLERRPGAFVVADTARPVLGLAALTALLASGAGIEGAIIGTAIGTAVAAIVAIVLLRGSYEPSFDLAEVKQIVLRGGHRAPIVLSFWLVQNADVFILSRFVSDTELGVYALASRLGFVVSFLPQGFRMAMRPLRKSAAFQAVRDQYGRATVQGQLLGYFTLLCIFAVLVMILGGEVLVDVAPAAYAGAAGLIPFTAAAFVMPSVYRTVNQNVNLAPQADAVHRRLRRRRDLAFVVITIVLAPEIGAYAAPIGMLVGFGVPSLLMFARNQTRQAADRLPLPGGRCSRSRSPPRSPALFQLLELGSLLELGIAVAGAGRLPRHRSCRCG